MKELRALVVDDSQAMRRSIMYALKRLAGLECVEAEDGVEALKRLNESKFDVVVTDINMPQMDGLKLISHMRGEPRYKGLPIVVITTERAQEDRAKAMALGADAYLTKPVQGQRVVDVVKGLLKL